MAVPEKNEKLVSGVGPEVESKYMDTIPLDPGGKPADNSNVKTTVDSSGGSGAGGPLSGNIPLRGEEPGGSTQEGNLNNICYEYTLDEVTGSTPFKTGKLGWKGIEDDPLPYGSQKVSFLKALKKDTGRALFRLYIYLEHLRRNRIAGKQKAFFVKKKKIAFWAPVPGAGCKETAMNTAVLMARRGEGDICIIDLDYYNPIMEIFSCRDYGREDSPVHGSSYIDSCADGCLRGGNGHTDVYSYMLRHESYDNLYIAAGLGRRASLDEDACSRAVLNFIEECYNEFDYVFVVCSNTQGYKSLSSVFKICDAVYTVMEATEYHIERVACHLNILNGISLFGREKLKIVVNKYDAAYSNDWKSIGRLYGYRVVTALKFNPLHIGCRNTGKIFVEKSCRKDMEEYLHIIKDIGYIPKKGASLPMKA